MNNLLPEDIRIEQALVFKNKEVQSNAMVKVRSKLSKLDLHEIPWILSHNIKEELKLNEIVFKAKVKEELSENLTLLRVAYVVRHHKENSLLIIFILMFIKGILLN